MDFEPAGPAEFDMPVGSVNGACGSRFLHVVQRTVNYPASSEL